jgi:hypothetical protein
MVMTRRNLKPAGLFALEVTKVLVAGKITNTELARRPRDRGYQGSRQAVDNHVAGKRGPEGEMVEQVGRALELPDDRIIALHRAATPLDRGFQVTLDGRLDGSFQYTP